jgi:hypothetical protein
MFSSPKNFERERSPESKIFEPRANQRQKSPEATFDKPEKHKIEQPSLRDKIFEPKKKEKAITETPQVVDTLSNQYSIPDITEFGTSIILFRIQFII